MVEAILSKASLLFLNSRRAAAIDRGIYTEAQKEGLCLWEVEGTRQDVGAGLQGAVYSFRHLEPAVA